MYIRWTTGVLLGLTTCFALALSACGGSSGNTGTAGTSNGTTGTSNGIGGDCRMAGSACAFGFVCSEADGAWECIPEGTNTSNGTTATSNGTTSTSNGTTSTSNGTTSTSNGTTSTSNGTTSTSNGTTGGLCDDVNCPDGQECDPETGACSGDPCEDVSCNDGQVCEDGACVDVDLCEGVQCPGDQICVEGECLTFVCENDDESSNETFDRATMLSGDSQLLEMLAVCDGDMDWYQLRLGSGQDAIIDALFDHDHGDLDMFLYAADGTTELQRSRTGDDDEHLFIAPVDSGTTFYILVKGARDDEANYILDVEIDPEGDVCFIEEDCRSNTSCEDNVCVDDPPCDSNDDCARGELCNFDSGECFLFECLPDDNEGDDTLGAATVLNAENQIINDLTLCADNQDWFTFTLAAGQDARVTMDLGGGEGDLDMRIYANNEGTLLGNSTGESDFERVGVPITDAQTTIYVQIYGFPRGDVPGENSYTLTVEIDPEGFACNAPNQCGSNMCDDRTRLCVVDCLNDDECDVGEICDELGACVATICLDDEAEPNNIQEEAVQIEEGITDRLALCGNENDWFRFTVGQDNTRVFITLEFTHREGDIEADLIDGNNGFQAFGRTSTDNEYLVADLDTGVYWVQVSHDIASRDVSTAYSINMEFNPNRATCLADSDCGPAQECGDTFECVGLSCFSNRDCPISAPICSFDTERCVACDPDVFDSAGSNDSLESATNINGNLVPIEVLNTCAGEDFYRFTASAGQLLTVDLMFEHEDGDLDMLLSFPDGDFEASFSGTNNEQISITATLTGTYTLRVYTLSNPAGQPAYNTYQLSVSITDP